MTENKSIEQFKSEFLTLIAKADTDKAAKQDVAELRKFLQKHPELWVYAGNLAGIAAHNLINSVASTPPLTESLKIGYKQLQKDLGVENATMMEKLLIEHVVSSWLRLYVVEFHYSSAMTESISINQGEYWEKRLNAAQRRFLRACTTLARMRKIGLPALQINVANQQVNQVNP